MGKANETALSDSDSEVIVEVESLHQHVTKNMRGN